MKKRVMGTLALATVLGCASMVPAATISWAVNAAGSWGVDGNWSATPAWDGTDDVRLIYTDGNGVTSSRILTLDGDRVINSLDGSDLRTPIAGNAGWTFTVNPGTPSNSKLTILSGDITADNRGKVDGSGFARPLNMENTSVQIGDGITPVTGAVWHINSSMLSGDPGVAGTKVTRLTMGEYSGIAGTLVTITGITSQIGTNSNSLELTKASTAFHGTLRNEQVRLTILANVSDSLGAGVLEHAGNGNFQITFTGVDNTQNAEIRLLGGSTSLQNQTASSTTTLNGNLTGTGNVEFNRVGFGSTTRRDTATVIMTGAANTLSGTVNIAAGVLRIDGVWTGAGTVTHSRGSLQGIGSLGMASGKNLNVTGESAVNIATIAPGTAGTVGTLTVGTDNTNTIAFNANSFLSIDIGGALADRLVIYGNLNLTHVGNTLVFNELSAPTLPYYTLVSYTGSLSGTFANVTGVPAGYSLSYDTPGEIRLVNPDIIPEPATLGLLAVGGLVMIRRHRRGD